jgi:hypothetical protein
MTQRLREIYVSVDIEADGKIPGDFSMVSLGAVVAGAREADGSITKFDLDDPQNSFKVEIKPISEQWNAEALAVSGFSREHFITNGLEPVEAMTSFAQWVNDANTAAGSKAPVFAAFPLGFDWLFTYWYLVKFSEIESPFSHGRHIDIKTEYASVYGEPITRAGKRYMPRSIMSTRRHTHDPLDDAKEQADLLMNILEERHRQLNA